MPHTINESIVEDATLSDTLLPKLLNGKASVAEATIKRHLIVQNGKA